MKTKLPIEFFSIPPVPLAMQDVGYTISQPDKCGFFLCQEGEIEILLENKPCKIGQGDLFIYSPSMLLRIERLSPDLKGTLISVDLEFLLANARKIINPREGFFLREHPCLSPSPEQYRHIERAIETLRSRLNETDFLHLAPQRRPIVTELLSSMGQVLCYEILDIYLSHKPIELFSLDRKDRIFQNFMISLYHNHRTERDVAFYAQQQYLTPRYFSTIIRERSGTSALQWIIRVVIADAKQLLKDSDRSIKEIATALNFSTQSFFGKYFKQYVGISPTEYREGKQGRQPAHPSAASEE